jgi:hypothetical protein
MAAAAAIAGHFVDIRNWTLRQPSTQSTAQEVKA